MKRIIVPTGYMGSGSSAVTNLISEYRGFSNDYDTYEYVFLHCPNGIFDFEDKILKNNTVVKSDEAIRRFRSEMEKLYNKKHYWVGNYEKILTPKFLTYTEEFIKSLNYFNYPGFYYKHEEVNFNMYIKLILKKFKLIKTPKILKYKNGMEVCFPSDELFYKSAKRYIEKSLEKYNNEDVILDQLLLPHNLYRIDNYFDNNLKVIVVERDPRDVFILNKYAWQSKNIQVPYPLKVEEFCEYYKNMRESEKMINNSKILRIKFENLIYDYDRTVKEIEKFVGLEKENHIKKYTKLDPKISINNTQIFKDEKYSKEIDYIEKELKEYLYNFPKEKIKKIELTID